MGVDGPREELSSLFINPYPSPPPERVEGRVGDDAALVVIDTEPVPPLVASSSLGIDGSSSMLPSPSSASTEEPPTPPPEVSFPLFGSEDRVLLGGRGTGADGLVRDGSRRPKPAPIATNYTPPRMQSQANMSAGGMGAHDTRRNSVYLPLTADTQSAIWKPFGALEANIPSPMAPPKSPSAIHPSYGARYSTEVDEGKAEGLRSGLRALGVPLVSHAAKRSDPPRLFYGAPKPGVFDNPRVRRLFDSPAAWLVLYFMANLGLTLYNKMVLVKFPFPWSLTAIHTLCGTAGAQFALNRGFFTPARITRRESLVLLAFSGLYTINIAVSNLSLHLVTVPFHQVVRAMTPLFAIAISVACFRKRYSRNIYFSLVPIIAGVAFATYGDYYFTWWGLVLTLFGTVLAALKTVMTNYIQVGRLKLHPLDLLLRMSPLAFVQCVIASWYTGELERVRAYGGSQMTSAGASALLVNGLLAFLLNVVNFSANKKTSPLTMTVAANVKQVLTILLAVMMFNLKVTGTNLLGIVLTLGGGMLYAGIEFEEKRQRDRRFSEPLSAVSMTTLPR